MSGNSKGAGAVGGTTTDAAGNILYPIRNADGSIRGYTVAKNSTSSKPTLDDMDNLLDNRNGGKHKALNGSIVKSLKRI